MRSMFSSSQNYGPCEEEKRVRVRNSNRLFAPSNAYLRAPELSETENVDLLKECLIFLGLSTITWKTFYGRFWNSEGDSHFKLKKFFKNLCFFGYVTVLRSVPKPSGACLTPTQLLIFSSSRSKVKFIHIFKNIYVCKHTTNTSKK